MYISLQRTTLQFRRQKSSAVSKLRRYIMKKLLSFTKTRSHSKYGSVWPAIMQDSGSGPGRDDGMEIGGEAAEEAMETAELVIDTGTAKSSDGSGEGGGGEGEGGEEEVTMEEGFDSTLALVDHLEIEISDREGGEDKSEPGLGAAGIKLLLSCHKVHVYTVYGISTLPCVQIFEARNFLRFLRICCNPQILSSRNNAVYLFTI